MEMTKMKFINNSDVSDLYPGLNEITDAFDAFPYDLVSYFTLLKEIDAKCVYTVPYLNVYIHRFLEMNKEHPKREILLRKIRVLIKELMPCLEEKMHVATIASDIASKHLQKIEQCSKIIYDNEIPEDIRVGPLHDPCMRPMEPTEVYLRRTDSRDEVLLTRRRQEEEQKGKHGKRHNGTENHVRNLDSTQNQLHSHTHHGNTRRHHSEESELRFNIKKPKIVKPKKNIKSLISLVNVEKQKITRKERTNKNRTSLLEHTLQISGNLQPNNHSTQKAGIEAKKREENSKSTEAIVHVNSHATIADIATALAGSISPASENVKQSVSSNKSGTKKKTRRRVNSKGEPIYCYCGQVSYGEMVGCDGEDCEKEWFHLPCTGLKEPPKGAWYCEDCKSKMRRKRALQQAH